MHILDQLFNTTINPKNSSKIISLFVECGYLLKSKSIINIFVLQFFLSDHDKETTKKSQNLANIFACRIASLINWTGGTGVAEGHLLPPPRIWDNYSNLFQSGGRLGQTMPTTLFPPPLIFRPSTGSLTYRLYPLV